MGIRIKGIVVDDDVEKIKIKNSIGNFEFINLQKMRTSLFLSIVLDVVTTLWNNYIAHKS